MNKPDMPPPPEETSEEDNAHLAPKLPPGAVRVLRTVEKLANPSPASQKLAWFDKRGKKVRKALRDLRALDLPTGKEGGEP